MTDGESQRKSRSRHLRDMLGKQVTVHRGQLDSITGTLSFEEFKGLSKPDGFYVDNMHIPIMKVDYVRRPGKEIVIKSDYYLPNKNPTYGGLIC